MDLGLLLKLRTLNGNKFKTTVNVVYTFTKHLVSPLSRSGTGLSKCDDMKAVKNTFNDMLDKTDVVSLQQKRSKNEINR